MNDVELKQIDAEIAHLKYAFDQYFMGLERQAPMDEYEKLNKKIRNLTTVQIGNTALKFQRNNMVAKFNSYQSYWNRILKQIEEGTYKRDRLRAAKINASASNKSAATSTAPAAAPQAAPQVSPATATAGSEHYSQVFAQYQQALCSLGQQTNLTAGALSAVLTKQAAAIKSKYGCRDVTFKVAVENGKAQIKAVPVK